MVDLIVFVVFVFDVIIGWLKLFYVWIGYLVGVFVRIIGVCELVGNCFEYL